MTPRMAVTVMASALAMACLAIPATGSSTYPKDLAAEKAAADKGDIVGRWIEPGIGGYGLITIRKKGTGFVILGKPLGKAEEEVSTLTEHRSPKGRQFDVANETHDRYTIRPDGSLDVSDDSGLIDKALPIPATMVDPKQVDQAIAAASAPKQKPRVATVAPMQTSSAGVKPVISPEELNTGAEYFVRPKLRDPASGQFSNLHGSGDYFCGYVNAKNGFGGYTGAQRFAVVVIAPFVGQVFFEQQTPSKVFQDSWAKCAS